MKTTNCGRKPSIECTVQPDDGLQTLTDALLQKSWWRCAGNYETAVQKSVKVLLPKHNIWSTKRTARSVVMWSVRNMESHPLHARLFLSQPISNNKNVRKFLLIGKILQMIAVVHKYSFTSLHGANLPLMSMAEGSASSIILVALSPPSSLSRHRKIWFLNSFSASIASSFMEMLFMVR